MVIYTQVVSPRPTEEYPVR